MPAFLAPGAKKKVGGSAPQFVFFENPIPNAPGAKPLAARGIGTKKARQIQPAAKNRSNPREKNKSQPKFFP